jgi:hypothetical protein
MSVISGSLHVNGTLTAKRFSAPAGSIDNASVDEAAEIAATKLIHQFPLTYQQAPGSEVVSNTVDLHIARGDGEVVSIEAAITGAIATGADRTVTLDLLKSTAGGAFATVLTAPIVLDDDNVLRTLEAGTVTTTDYLDGDILRLTVVCAGAASAQGQGLVVTTIVREEPD